MCKIVIADDEYLERDVFKRVISGIDGARVVGEGNCGRLAVELCAAMRPDLVFVNCGMGGIDGFEAAKRIRRANKEITIVMTSASERNFSLRRLNELEINDFLLKPIRPSRLENTIRKYLRKGLLADAETIPPRKKKNLRFYPNQIMCKEITRALIYIDNNYNRDISLQSAAELVSLSSYYFSRLFKKEVGVNFSDFLKLKRLNSAKRMLADTDKSIMEISLSVGYQEQSYFSKVFKKATGQTPRDYRKQSENTETERTRVINRYI